MRMTSTGLIAGAAGLAVGLTGLEFILEGEPFEAGDFAIDLVEKVFLLGAMAAVAIATQDIRAVRIEQEALREDLDRAVAEGAEWRERSRRHLTELSAEIARQFDEWGLSRAEAEIAFLMLKGMALKQIATARDTSEATIRQQASQVYRKSGLSGRAELSAYFLDSLSPHEQVRAAE